ncbi:MAG TPA: polymer-forming cytoskeletal protein [Xanthomonadales bacterium]
MFEKHRNVKQEAPVTQSQQDSFAAPASTPVNSGRSALIGPGIHVNGDISGDENLLIEGRVDGKIRLDLHTVEIGQSGCVNADIKAKVIKIAGEVRGDITGTEKVIISRSGNVHGNIVAPRMTLEDGAIFKGSIDMDPGESAKAKIATPVKKAVEKPAEKIAEAPKVVASGSVNESKSYTLNGS